MYYGKVNKVGEHKFKVVVRKNLDAMEDRKQFEYWSNFIIMIHSGYQNADIMTATQHPMNTMQVVRYGIDSYKRDYT